MEFNEYTNAPEATAPKNKPRKSSGAAKSIVTVLLCVLLGGGAGFLGGYYAKGGSRTIILQQTQTPTPKARSRRCLTAPYSRRVRPEATTPLP